MLDREEGSTVIKGSFRVPVSFDYVFPYGALCLDVSAAMDFDVPADAGDRQARDKDTGERIWHVTVLDLDPDAARLGRGQVKVKVIAAHQPVPPAPAVPGYPAAVEFVGLTVTPWTDNSKCHAQGGRCKARMGYSLRADDIIPGQIAANYETIPA